MESVHQQLKSRGTTLDTDPSSATRLAHRPKSSQTAGATYEDYGSSFGNKASQSRASSTSRKPSKKPGPSGSGVVIPFNSDSDSEDEIDFLSGSSRHTSESPKPPKGVGKRATSVASSSRPSQSSAISIAIDHHQADPNYKPVDLKSMKFSKTKKSDVSSSSTPESSQSSLQNGLDIRSSSSRPPPPSSTAPEKKKALPLRERTPNQDRPRPRRPSTPPRQETSEARKEQDKDADRTPRPSRPAPRPVNKGNRNSLGKYRTVPDLRIRSQERPKEKSQPISRSQSTQELTGSHSTPIHVSDDDSDGAKTDMPRRKTYAKAQGKGKGRAQAADSDINPFPDMSPLSSQAAARARSPGKGKEKGKERAREDPIGAMLKSPSYRKRKEKDLAPFPIMSPLSSPASRSGSPPAQLQTSSNARSKRPGGKRKKNVIMSSSEDEEEERPLAPFPMATQVLESLRRASPVHKRTSPDSGIDEESGAYRKKRRRDSEKFSLDIDSDSDDEMFFNPAVDPKTLCPWCDEPLPSEPTPHLRALIAAAKRVSYPDDRLTNPLGLRAPLTAFVGVCQRHRFERNWIPRARKRGWPTTIDWDALSGRISRLRGGLQAIVDDVDEEFASVAPLGSGGSRSRRARKENEFWMEVVKNVRQQGSRQIAGVRGQFLHFNKTQPGYYGELGYVIIHQTLCDMFPPAGFHPDATLPLTPADFIALVLVPEAAVRLIIDDLSLPRDEAIETLRESVEYGVAMFPADEGEGGGGGNGSDALGAGEQMFMERARARRKELEEEERIEKETARKERANGTGKPKPKPRPRGRAKADGGGGQTDGESVGRASSPPSSGKRKAPASRASSRARSTSKEPGGDVIVITSDTGDSDAGAPSKRRRKRRVSSSAKSSDVEMYAGDTDPLEATPKPKSKAKPRLRPVFSSGSRKDGDEGEQRSDAEVPINAPASSSPSASTRDRDHDTAYVSWDRKGAAQITKAGSGLTVDATPRAKTKTKTKAKTRRTDTLTTIPLSSSPPRAAAFSNADGLGAGSRCPLDIMRERRKQEQEQAARPSSPTSKSSDQWHSSLRDGNADSADEEEPKLPTASASASDHAKPKSKPPGSGTVYGHEGRKESFGWLLNSDDSPPPTASPPDLFQSYYD